MKTIYLDSTQIHSNTDNSLGFIVSPEIQGLEQPSIRLPSFDRPNVDGAVVPSQLYGGRLITFNGKVYASDVATYRTRRRTLESAVNIKKIITGGFNPITLKLTTMDDLALQVEVYTRKFDFPDKLLMAGNYKVEFFAPTLYLVSQAIRSQIVYVYDGGGMAIPTAIPTPFNANASALSILNNAGNVDAYPQIIITGPLDDPAITNESTGQVLNLDYTLTSGQYIAIDTDLRTVLYYSGVGASPTNIRDKMTGDFITLSPGNNTIKLAVAAFAAGNAQFSWRDSYSGI